jgi:hypothetical protein
MWRAGPPGGLHLQRNPTVRTVAQLRGWFQRETIRRPASGAARHTRFAFSTHRARKQMNSTRNTTVPTVSASTLEHEITQRAGYLGTCMDGSEIGPGGAGGEEVWAEPSGGGAVRVGVLRLT